MKDILEKAYQSRLLNISPRRWKDSYEGFKLPDEKQIGRLKKVKQMEQWHMVRAMEKRYWMSFGQMNVLRY